MRLLILVVLYKRIPSESETLVSLLEESPRGMDVKVVVWDNSPLCAGDDSTLRGLSDAGFALEYIHTPENTWLSKVYNRILNNNEFDYALLLDQDTVIPCEYWRAVRAAILKHPEIKLFLPIVRSGEKIVSPGAYYWIKGRQWVKSMTGVLRTKNTVAITSGMLLSKSIFVECKKVFDERLSLYGIDTSFMLDFCRNEGVMYVLDVEINHHTLLWSNPPSEIMLDRFRKLRSAWKIIHGDKLGSRILIGLYAFYSSVKMALRYRDFRFLM